MNDVSTKKKTADVPKADSLAEMPEVTDRARFRRRPGRGHHAGLRAGNLVRIEPDVLAYFGSAEAVNEVLREAMKRSGRAK